MVHQLRVHLLPRLTRPRETAGRTVVVIDVLRASTTMTCALAAGAQEVIPCLEVQEARRIAHHRRLTSQNTPVLLGGERGGRPIPGFDLGNSPQEYVPPRLAGATVVFTTTNGTRALAACVGAGQVLIGAFVNLSPLCRALARSPQVDLMCAGTDGQISCDDVLLAGAVVQRLLDGQPAHPVRLNDQAQLARDAWQASVGTNGPAQKLVAALKNSQAGRNLIAIGQEDDIAIAAAIDRWPVVPFLDLQSWSVRKLT